MSRFIHSAAVVGITLLFLVHVTMAVPVVQSTWEGPLLEPNRTYEQKMRLVWGWSPHFDFMQFVQANTPDHSVLLFDPNYRYATITLYFLYPRKIVYGNEETLRKRPEIDYVVISEGFPSFSVSGERIMFDDKHGLYRIYK
jgi:hypothetical protein